MTNHRLKSMKLLLFLSSILFLFLSSFIVNGQNISTDIKLPDNNERKSDSANSFDFEFYAVGTCVAVVKQHFEFAVVSENLCAISQKNMA